MPQGDHGWLRAWSKWMGMNELSATDQPCAFNEVMCHIRLILAVIDHDEGSTQYEVFCHP